MFVWYLRCNCINKRCPSFKKEIKAIFKIDEIREASSYLRNRIVETPVLKLSGTKISPYLPAAKSVAIKLELFQHVGSFKARGVLLAIKSLGSSEKKSGVIAVSAGNHALAVAWASHLSGINAKVIMPKSADKSRIDGCKAFGVEPVLVDTASDGFEKMGELASKEGRTILHPFESEHMILGAATCGLEMIESIPNMDIAIIPVGGGGLISGISLGIKSIKPSVKIFGVEPFGADSTFQSLAQDTPVSLDKVKTIADSLGSPMSLPETFSIIKTSVEEILRITDNELVKSMILMRDKLSMFVEPACASSLAALNGPMEQKVRESNVALIACGSNITQEKFQRLCNY